MEIVIEKLSLIENQKQLATIISFDARRNILIAPNGAGKSIIVKSIFWTLGAEPEIFSKEWLNSKPTAHLTLSINGIRTEIARNGSLFYVCQHTPNEKIRKSFHSPKLFWYFFEGLVGVDAVAKSKTSTDAHPDGRIVDLHAQHILAGFYVDQDKSWLKAWHQFKQMNYIRDLEKTLFNYTVGATSFTLSDDVRKREKYKAKMMPYHLQKNQILTTYGVLKDRLTHSKAFLPIELSTEVIRELVADHKKIATKQQELNKQLTKLEAQIRQLDHELHLYQGALTSLDKDHQKIQQFDWDSAKFVCPTCEHVHGVDLAVRFGIHHNRSTLKASINEVTLEKRRVDADRASVLEELESLRLESALLKRRKNIQPNITIDDLVKTESHGSLLKELKLELESIDSAIAPFEKEISQIDQSLSQKFENISVDLFALFSEKFATYTALLELELFEPNRKALLKGSFQGNQGSLLPRILLAYYAALDAVAIQHGKFVFPLVIDTPKQQDLDAANIKLMARFFEQNIRKHSKQLIVASTIEGFEEVSGFKIIEPRYDNKNFLSSEEYEEASDALSKALG